MKKKMICLLAAVLFGVLLLCSCGSVAGYPFTTSDREVWCDGYVLSKGQNGILTFRRAEESEEIPLCFDPLCDHSNRACPAASRSLQFQMAAARNRDGELCAFFTDMVLCRDSRPPYEYSLCCINTKTGAKTLLLGGLTEKIIKFCIYEDDIYLYLSGSEENDEGKLVYQTELWKMSVDGSNLMQLPGYPEQVGNIIAMAKVKGKTAIYWSSNGTLYVSPEDLSEKTAVVAGLSKYDYLPAGDYLYYTVQSAATAPEMRVEAYPKDKNQNPDGTYTLYPETELAAYYRLNLTDPDAPPELMYDGTSGYYVNSKLLWANGNKIYVIPHDPVFLEVLDAYAVVDYVCTKTTPNKIPLQYEYINARSGMKIIEIDLVTGERREIPTPGFNPESIMGGDDKRLVVKGSVVDIDRIRNRIRELTEEEGAFPLRETYMFSEIQTIDLNP